MIGWLSGLIPAPYQLAAAIVAAVLAALACIGLGLWLAASHYQPLIDDANTQLGAMEQAYLTLASETTRQNAAIEALETERRRLAAHAKAEAIRAHEQAMPLYRAGAAILGQRLSLGQDPCTAAAEAFDAELRDERSEP